MGAFVKFTLSFLLLSALSASSQAYEEPNLSPTSHLHAKPSPSPSPPPPPPPLAPPTSYILSVQWASGFCSQPDKKCTSSFTKNFSIHGLWPSPSTTRQVQYVPKALLPDLRATMAREWLSLETQTSNEVFWAKQWMKHGKDQLMSQADYFQQGINLFDQHSAKLLDSLRAKGFPPHPNQLYKLTDITEALKEVYKVDVKIVCRTYSGSRRYRTEQYKQLEEIRIRYSAKFILQNNFAEDESCKEQEILFNL